MNSSWRIHLKQIHVIAILPKEKKPLQIGSIT